jgi:hypothetical protein
MQVSAIYPGHVPVAVTADPPPRGQQGPDGEVGDRVPG